MEKLLTPSMADLVVWLVWGSGTADGGLGVWSRGSEEDEDMRRRFSGWK